MTRLRVSFPRREGRRDTHLPPALLVLFPLGKRALAVDRRGPCPRVVVVDRRLRLLFFGGLLRIRHGAILIRPRDCATDLPGDDHPRRRYGTTRAATERPGSTPGIRDPPRRRCRRRRNGSRPARPWGGRFQRSPPTRSKPPTADRAPPRRGIHA